MAGKRNRTDWLAAAANGQPFQWLTAALLGSLLNHAIAAAKAGGIESRSTERNRVEQTAPNHTPSTAFFVFIGEWSDSRGWVDPIDLEPAMKQFETVSPTEIDNDEQTDE